MSARAIQFNVHVRRARAKGCVLLCLSLRSFNPRDTAATACAARLMPRAQVLSMGDPLLPLGRVMLTRSGVRSFTL